MAAVTLGCRALAALLVDGRGQTFGDAEWGGDAGTSMGFSRDGFRTYGFHVFFMAFSGILQ